MGLNHDPDTYKVSALPIELKHRNSALICVPCGQEHTPPKIATIFTRLSYMPHHEHIGMEPTAGIEPAHSAWKADVLPLNYIGKRGRPHGKEKKANVILRR